MWEGIKLFQNGLGIKCSWTATQTEMYELGRIYLKVECEG